MIGLRHSICASLMILGTSAASFASDDLTLTYAEALTMARERSPMVAVSRGRETVVWAEGRVAAIYPNPSVSTGTTTQAAKITVGVTVPLVILGQIGAATAAGRAEFATAKIDTEVTATEVHAGAAHAYVALWLAERTSSARADATELTKRLQDAVRGRVEVGSAPELESLRARAEYLRAAADSRAASELVNAAAADLGRWIGGATSMLRTNGDPTTPDEAPPFAQLADRVPNGPAVRREESDVRAAQARADRERAMLRPAFVLDVGADFQDPSSPAPNYHGQIGIEVPLFNQRGPLIEREVRAAAVARLRSKSEAIARVSDLTVSYETFVALTHRLKALEEGVVPAAEAAAQATEESYRLGRATLVTVLDSERARIDARLTFLDTKAARANAWIDVGRAVGEL